MENRQDAMTSESMNAAACDSGKRLQEGARRTSLAEVQAWALPSGQCCRQSRVREVYVVGSPCLPPFPPPCPSARCTPACPRVGRCSSRCLLLGGRRSCACCWTSTGPEWGSATCLSSSQQASQFREHNGFFVCVRSSSGPLSIS